MVRPRVPPSTALTPHEKAQLKEKLASLKREYSRTFHRLQRAERAEKTRNCAKKSVAEDSLLLLEEGSGNCLPESTSQASEKVCVATGPEANATKVPSPIFKPETFSQGDGLPENHESALPTPEHQRAIFSPLGSGSERKQNLWSKRRRTSAQQRITLAGVEEPACSAIQKNAGCLPSCPASSVEGSRSPVFKRNSFWESDHPIPNASFGDPFDERHCHERPIAEPQPRCLQEMAEEAAVPSAECFQEENRVPVLETSGAKGVTLDKGASKEAAEYPGRAAELASSSPIQGRRGAICERTVETRNGGNQSEVPQNVDLRSLNTESKKPGEQNRLKPSLPEGEPAASTDSVLSSCTVVEGLPFPVEYYVRTTRRMSTCQREVNVAAVIQSQLGKKTKGRRVSQKKGADPASSCQDPTAASGISPNANGGDTGSVAASPERLPLTDKGLPCHSGLLPHQKGRLRRRRKGSQASSGTFQTQLENLELTAPGASSCRVSGEAHVYDGAEPQTVQSSNGLNLEAESSASLVGGLEGDHQQPCSETGNENHGRNECMQLDNVPEPSLASLEWRDRGTLPGSKQGRPCAGSQGPVSRGLPGKQSVAFPLHVKAKEATGLKGQRSHLGHKELHLYEDGIGVLKSEKLRTREAGLPLETFDPGDSTASFENASLLGGEIPLKETAPALPPLAQQDLSSSKLLLSPAPEGLSCVAESQLLTPVFPLVGTTPASQSPLRSKVLTEAFCPCSSEGKADPKAEQEDSANAPTLQEDGTQEEAPGTTMIQSQGQDGMHWEPEMDVRSPPGTQMPPENSVERHKGSIEQDETTVEDETKVPGDCGWEGRLRLTSKLKSFSGSCSVDASTVWWETGRSKELCVLTACETSVTLWRQLDSGQWGALHTWLFEKVPVIQLVSLPEVCSLACVALGGVEIAEIQFLFQSSEDGSAKQSLAKAGNIKAVLGLRDRTLVSSCGSLKQQEVELMSFSGAGRSNKTTALTPPEETVIAFAEVEGRQEALLGMTAMNCVVIWNMKTGQLLQKMPVSCSFPASLCHKAYSESGLLFVIVGHPHAKESTSCGNPAFQLFVFNPKTARSAGISFLTLPLGTAGRYLEGEVWETSAAAVLTSGAIVVWDLFLGRCTALLPPSPEGNWSHVRWSVTGSCLLAGQKDGTVYIYDYTAGPRSA